MDLLLYNSCRTAVTNFLDGSWKRERSGFESQSADSDFEKRRPVETRFVSDKTNWDSWKTSSHALLRDSFLGYSSPHALFLQFRLYAEEYLLIHRYTTTENSLGVCGSPYITFHNTLRQWVYVGGRDNLSRKTCKQRRKSGGIARSYQHWMWKKCIYLFLEVDVKKRYLAWVCFKKGKFKRRKLY